MNSKENYNNSTLDLAVKDMRDALERTHHAALLTSTVTVVNILTVPYLTSHFRGVLSCSA